MLEDPKTNECNRYWKLLANLHKPKHLTAIDRFVPAFGLKSSSFNIHELIAADMYDFSGISAGAPPSALTQQ